MAENKTKPTLNNVDDFLSTVSIDRQNEAKQLISVMHTISGLNPVMWGPSIIGFGSQHYKYDTGREGDMPKLSFSPRKAAITVYVADGFEHYSTQLTMLGKHKTSVSCLYVNRLTDIDMAVLQDILQQSYDRATQPTQKTISVQDYIDQVPQIARTQFDTLRQLVKTTLPHATEVVSYGIIGYKIDNKRARVFISGWKDHVSVYPVPKDPELQKELAPYIRGKGTLWFALDAPLPKALIKKASLELAKP